MKKLYIISDKIIKILIILLSIIALINLLILKDNIYINIDMKKIIILIIFILLLIIFFKWLKKNLKLNINIKNKINIIFAISILIFQLIYVISIFRLIGFDPIRLYTGAFEIVNGSKLGIVNLEYFSRCYNNVPLLLIYIFIFRFMNIFNFNAIFNILDYVLPMIIFNIIMIDFAILYIHKVLKKIFGSKYNDVSFIFIIPMIAITPWIGVVYTDTLSLLFPVIIFYLYLLYKENNKLQYIIYMTATLTISILIKPTNIIIFIAIILLESINFNRKIEYKELIKRIIVFLMVIFILTLSYNLIQFSIINKYISKQQFEDNKFPFTHFIMMGLKDTEKNQNRYGMYYEEDVQSTKSYVGIKAKKEFNINKINKRLSDMGIKGYLEFLYNKYTWIISDGTFYYGREGNFYAKAKPINNSDFAQKIQNYAYFDEEGYKNITVNFEQAMWILIIGLILIDSLLNIRKIDNININILRLSVIGIILFILLFEARSRYLFHYLPIFIILAINGIKSVDENLNRLKIKLYK